ncbi:hypothetical protein RB195_016677 [Necator americanus]
MAGEGCLTRTNPYTLTFTYGCSTCKFYGPVLNHFGFIFPTINFILYVFIYIQIIAVRLRLDGVVKSDKWQRRRKDIILVFQFSLICALQFASSALFYILPPLLPGNDLAYHFPMIISTMNTMTNPVAMLLFQPRLRKAYTSLITKFSVAPSVAQISVVPL